MAVSLNANGQDPILSFYPRYREVLRVAISHIIPDGPELNGRHVEVYSEFIDHHIRTVSSLLMSAIALSTPPEQRDERMEFIHRQMVALKLLCLHALERVVTNDSLSIKRRLTGGAYLSRGLSGYSESPEEFDVAMFGGRAELVELIEKSLRDPEIIRNNMQLIGAWKKSLKYLSKAMKAPRDDSDEAELKRAQFLETLPCANLECQTVKQPGEGKIASKKCSGCKTLRYCSPECQKMDWRRHKKACGLLAASS